MSARSSSGARGEEEGRRKGAKVSKQRQKREEEEKEEEELYRVAVVDRFDDDLDSDEFQEAQWTSSWVQDKQRKKQRMLAVAQYTSLTQAAMQAADEIAITDIHAASVAQRAITIGNTYHKAAVLTGLAGLVGSSIRPMRIPSLGLLGISVTCALAYDLDWQHDFLCKYQVHRDRTHPPIVCQYLSPGSEATVLVRRDDSARKVLHNTMALAALGAAVVTVWKAGWLPLE